VTPAGIYVHVPFCRRRCPFCAFLVTVHRDFLGRFVAAVPVEAARRAAEIPGPFDSLYLGGGTPSYVPVTGLRAVLDGVRTALPLLPGAEVTVEANPDDLDAAYLAGLREAGVTRLSLGLQSLDDDDLARLGRTHDAAQGLGAFRAARAAGFPSLSVDLLYGLPWRGPGEEREMLLRVAALGPDHVSAYQLTFEEGTPLLVRSRRGGPAPHSEEEERERILLARETLESAGFAMYEVSNFARAPAHRSRHNAKYWTGVPYLGLGPAAHSFRGRTRRWNLAPVRRYVAEVEAGRDPVEGFEVLTDGQRLLERLFLGLRTVEGLPRADLPPAVLARLPALEAEGLIAPDPHRLRLTPAGLPLADAIARDVGNL
jgi:oxygen-independent coproporphyrinogen-3 oxidase